MFHRVKSETTVKEREDVKVTVTDSEAQSGAQGQAQRALNSAQKSTTLSQQDAAATTTDTEKDTQVADTATAEKSSINSPAQSLYQGPAAAAAQPQSQPAAPARPQAFTPRYTPPAAPKRAEAPVEAETTENDRRLTIGRGITMSGEIESCDELQVEGTVEAALKGAKFLNIAESGVFYGTVEIEDAVIAGRFEGEIVVNGRLTVEETGVITGSISYKELEINSGAIVDGRITPLNTVSAKEKAADAPLFADVE